MIVEDSFLMRKVIGDAINADPALEVIYKAKNGREGLEKILELKPDIVTLDINLPLLDGIAVLKRGNERTTYQGNYAFRLYQGRDQRHYESPGARGDRFYRQTLGRNIPWISISLKMK